MKRPDPGPTDAFQLEQESLRQHGAPDTRSHVGQPLPAVPLLATDGQETTLDEARLGRPAVIVFYRGAWCPFCNIALRAYQQHLLPVLSSRGIALIAVSPQKPDGSLTMQEKNALDFAVLSDAGNHLAAALGILTAPTDDAQALQREHGLDLTAHNADETPAVPMPTVVILDASGVVRWIDVHPDYTSRTEPDEILAALDAAHL